MSDLLEARVTELEIRIAYQDQTIADLNDVVVRQQRDMDKLRNEMEALKGRMQAATVSMIATEAEETPPPHY